MPEAMSCNCACDWGGDDPADYCREAWRKARKKHTCVACRETIEPGERYCTWVYLYEGSWGQDKVCEPCENIRRDLCSCAAPEELVELILESQGFHYVTGETEDEYRERRKRERKLYPEATIRGERWMTSR